MIRLLLIFALVCSTASCGVVRNAAGVVGLGQNSSTRTRVEEDGVRFRAKTTADRSDRRSFVTSATPFAVDPEASIDAAVYQATRYCILTFGGSDTLWAVGPDTPREALLIEGDTVVLEGRCTQK